MNNDVSSGLQSSTTYRYPWGNIVRRCQISMNGKLYQYINTNQSIRKDLFNFKITFFDSTNDSDLKDIIITEQLIEDVIKSTSSHSAAGVPHIILREYVQELASTLSFTVKTFLDESYIPTQFKGSIITPIFKRGDTSVHAVTDRSKTP